MENSLILNDDLISPKFTYLRWIIIFFTVSSQVGYEYTGLILQSLQDQIEDALTIDSTRFNLIYLIGDSPIFITPIILGFAIDYYGPRRWIVVSTCMAFIGSLILILGFHLQDYAVVLVGRFIFSLLANGISLSTNKIICRWSEEGQVGEAMAFNLIIVRIPDILVNIITPWLYNLTKSIVLPFVVGSFICLFSFVSSLIASTLDKRLDAFEIKMSDSFVKRNNCMKCSDLKTVPKIVWLIILCSALSLSAFSSFYSDATSYLSSKFDFSLQTSGLLLIIVPAVSIISDLIVGYVIDKYGRRSLVINITISSLLIGIICLLFFTSSEFSYLCIIPLVFIGFYYGGNIVANCSSIPLMVKPEMIGIIFGILFFFNYLGGLASPVVFGYIEDSFSNEGDIYSTLYLAVLVLCALMIGLLIFSIDKKVERSLSSLKSSFMGILKGEYVPEISQSHKLGIKTNAKKDLRRTT